MPDPFITTQDLSDRIGIDVTADPGAIFAVEAACDVCRDIAEQQFNAGTLTERYDGTGSDALILAQRPVTKAGTVLVNGVAEPDFEFTAGGLLFRGTAGAGWFGGGIGWFGGGGRPVWPRGRLNVTVTYEFGYATVPKSVKSVALQIAARAVQQGPAKSETVGDVTAAFAVNASDLDVNELRILRKYRSVRS